MKAEEQVGLFTAEPLQVADDWETIRSRPIEQMICTELTWESRSSLLELGRNDVPEMLALTAATEPGPFLAETIQMGRCQLDGPANTKSELLIEDLRPILRW